MKMVKRFLVCFLYVCLVSGSNAREFHVSPSGHDCNQGSVAAPMKTIQAAAEQAMPGDTITVHEGVYRERINPPRGGTSDIERIVYQAAPGEKVVIKGSEIIKNWEQVESSVWKVELPNSFFGEYNPYVDLLEGDWLDKKGLDHHTGEVFIEGRSMFEKATLEEVENPSPYADARDKEASLYVWTSKVDDHTTTIWANFQGVDPNEAVVEINVREACFYPDTPGRDYITVRGFEMDQAATQWAAPTAEQPGMIGTHWSKGWIIENNRISNSKCVGIALGKDRSTGQNVWSNNPVKDGATHYNEVIFRALEIGWSKEHIGSHIVRNNEIFACGQAGIVGSLGAVFSQIYNNHIHDIWTKRIFAGAEMAGIKIHASIDMLIRNNHIHNTGRGIWIDWMAQGTRVTGNLLYDNTTDDLFSEVNHGPYLVDHNVFLSEKAIRDWSEGGAFVHNLIGGKIQTRQILRRFTPYHLPHSTQVAGLRNIFLGDNRYYNNLFIKPNHDPIDESQEYPFVYGLVAYHEARYPNQTGGNIYYQGAKPGTDEQNFTLRTDFDPEIALEITEHGLYLNLNIDDAIEENKTYQVTTELLGSTVVSEAIYEKPDGSPFVMDTDFHGNKRQGKHPIAGPFAKLKQGNNRILLKP